MEGGGSYARPTYVRKENGMLGFKIDTAAHTSVPVRVDEDGFAREIGCPADGVRTEFMKVGGREYAFVYRAAKYVGEESMASVIDKKNGGVIVDTCIVFGVESGVLRDLTVDELNQIYGEMYLISDGATETEAVMVD